MSNPEIKRTRITLSREKAAQLARKIEQAEREAPQVKRRMRPRIAEHQLMRRLLDGLRQERERQGVSMAELARRIEMDPANLSKLEKNPNANPTLQTLEKIAHALNKEVRFELADISSPESPREAA